MHAHFLIAAICMIQEAKQLVSHENLNLMQDEEYRHFCRKSSFQRGDLYESVRISKAGRNEFILVQAAKVKTDCNFQLTAVSNSNEQIVINNIFPTDHLYQNVMLLVACSKLLRQENYFRVWYHAGGILRRKPHDQSEGLKYVQIEPEPKCAARKGKRTNHSSAFVHFTLLRMRLPITNNTEQIWRRIGNATDMQQPRFRSYAMLSKYQQSIFVPDSFIGKHSSIVASSYYLALFIVISFITVYSFLP